MIRFFVGPLSVCFRAQMLVHNRLLETFILRQNVLCVCWLHISSQHLKKNEKDLALFNFIWIHLPQTAEIHMYTDIGRSANISS